MNYRKIIYFAELGTEETNWKPLLHLGNPFMTMDSAIKYVRNNYAFGGGYAIGLTTYDQKRRGNAMWDNF